MISSSDWTYRHVPQSDALFAYAGLVLSMVGIALWPAVALHAALAVWCVVYIRERPRG